MNDIETIISIPTFYNNLKKKKNDVFFSSYIKRQLPDLDEF